MEMASLGSSSPSPVPLLVTLDHNLPSLPQVPQPPLRLSEGYPLCAPPPDPLPLLTRSCSEQL